MRGSRGTHESSGSDSLSSIDDWHHYQGSAGQRENRRDGPRREQVSQSPLLRTEILKEHIHVKEEKS